MDVFAGGKRLLKGTTLHSVGLFLHRSLPFKIVWSICKQSSTMSHSARQWDVFLLHVGIAKSLSILQIAALGTGFLLWHGSANSFKNTLETDQSFPSAVCNVQAVA